MNESRVLPDSIAGWISLILIPPTVSTAVFTILVSVHANGSAAWRAAVWFVAVACSGWIQMAYVLFLRSKGRVTAYDVPERLDRTGPYIVSALISLAGFCALLLMRAPSQVWFPMGCFCANTLILAAINRFWKISAHMMGLTGPVMFLVPVFGAYALAALLPAPLLGWARLRVKAHTFAQVLAGAIVGMALTGVEMWLVGFGF
jgi:hypothetical protein